MSHMQREKQVTRRTFIGAAAALGGAVMVPTTLVTATTTEPTNGWKMRLAASSVQFGTLPIEQACEQIAALGFEAVDLWPAAPAPGAEYGCPHLQQVEERLGAAGLKEMLAKHNLTLSAMTCYWAGYPKYAELLSNVGGSLAVRGSRDGEPANVVAEMRAFFEQLQPEVELAEKYNAFLAIENHVGALLNSLDSFKAFVELNPSGRVGIALAPYHLQAARISVEDVIAVVGEQLLFFYAWQLGEGLNQLPGIGPTDCTPWIAALAEAGYRGHVHPFMHHHPEPDKMAAALTTSREYLIKCYREAMPSAG